MYNPLIAPVSTPSDRLLCSLQFGQDLSLTCSGAGRCCARRVSLCHAAVDWDILSKLPACPSDPPAQLQGNTKLHLCGDSIAVSSSSSTRAQQGRQQHAHSAHGHCRPVLFLKPPSAAVYASGPDSKVAVELVKGRGSVHYEAEVLLRLDADLQVDAVSLGLDLTLRDLQAGLKKNGHPWEIAKVRAAAAPAAPVSCMQKSTLQEDAMVLSLIRGHSLHKSSETHTGIKCCPLQRRPSRILPWWGHGSMWIPSLTSERRSSRSL